jgi:hypothetical protein
VQTSSSCKWYFNSGWPAQAISSIVAIQTAAVDPVLTVVNSLPGVQPMIALQEKERNLWPDHAPATALNSGALLPTNAAELQDANAASPTSSSSVHLREYQSASDAVSSAALKGLSAQLSWSSDMGQTGGAGSHREADTACVVCFSMC